MKKGIISCVLFFISAVSVDLADCTGDAKMMEFYAGIKKELVSPSPATINSPEAYAERIFLGIRYDFGYYSDFKRICALFEKDGHLMQHSVVFSRVYCALQKMEGFWVNEAVNEINNAFRKNKRRGPFSAPDYADEVFEHIGARFGRPALDDLLFALNKSELRKEIGDIFAVFYDRLKVRCEAPAPAPQVQAVDGINVKEEENDDLNAPWKKTKRKRDYGTSLSPSSSSSSGSQKRKKLEEIRDDNGSDEDGNGGASSSPSSSPLNPNSGILGSPSVRSLSLSSSSSSPSSSSRPSSSISPKVQPPKRPVGRDVGQGMLSTPGFLPQSSAPFVNSSFLSVRPSVSPSATPSVVANQSGTPVKHSLSQSPFVAASTHQTASASPFSVSRSSSLPGLSGISAMPVLGTYSGGRPDVARLFKRFGGASSSNGTRSLSPSSSVSVSQSTDENQ